MCIRDSADDGAIRIANVMKVTLAADHRCNDGANVGDFMNSLRRYLEQPEILSLETDVG